MTQTEALKLALEFVEANHSGGPDAFELITAIKETLSETCIKQSDYIWNGLTAEDINKAIEDNQRFGGFRKVGFAYDLERVLKEKNNG